LSLVTLIGAPIHALCLVAMGMPGFDEMDLELVGREAEKRKRWEFLVTAAPDAIPGGTGSLINPIATFSPETIDSAGGSAGRDSG
jgi:hypothetical protein